MLSPVNMVFILSIPVFHILFIPNSPLLNSGSIGNVKIPICVCFTIPKFNNRKYISGTAKIKIGIPNIISCLNLIRFIYSIYIAHIKRNKGSVIHDKA